MTSLEIHRKSGIGAGRRYVRVLLRKRGALFGGIVFGLLQSLLLLPLPLLLRRAFDGALVKGDRRELALLAAATVVVTAGSGLAAMVCNRLLQISLKGATADLRDRIVERVFEADLPTIDELDPEDVHERLIHDGLRVEFAVMTLLRQAIPTVVLIVGFVGLLLSIDPLLTVAAATAIPLLIISNRRMRPALSRSIEQAQYAFEDLGRHTIVSLRSQLLLRSRGIDRDERNKIAALIVQVRERSSKRQARIISHSVVQTTGLSVSSAITLVIGGQAVIAGRISTGSLLSFFAALALLRAPSGTLSTMAPTILEGRQSLGRLDSFLQRDMALAPIEDGRGTVGAIESVSLVGVTYAFHGRSPIVRDLDLTLTSGTLTALAGPNGSGKTTILTLLLGLIEPSAGTLLINGMPAHALDLRAFRRQIGVALQHPQFLPGTVRENLVFGREGMTDADVQRALLDAEADAVVALLPNGIDTEVGEDFERLSGGERQRLAIARALIGRPSLVVLDEPSNHLPNSVVVRVIESTKQWQRRPAMLLVSHEPQLLALADEVCSLGVVVHVDAQIATP